MRKKKKVKIKKCAVCGKTFKNLHEFRIHISWHPYISPKEMGIMLIDNIIKHLNVEE